MMDSVAVDADVDAERALVGALLLSTMAVADADGVDVGDFYAGKHGDIFAAARTLADRGDPVDVVTVADELDKRGQLEGVGGREYLADLLADAPHGASAGCHARIVREKADRRRLVAGLDAARNLAACGDDAGARAKLAELADGQSDSEPPNGTFLDWRAFWARDRREPEWVFPDVLARGRGHALYASHKAGKSRLMLDIAAKLATGSQPYVVCYLDYEMGEDDVYERLDAMGYGPDSDLTRLRYALLPTLPPLDTPDGARDVTAVLDNVQAAWPDHHLVVVFDTTARAVVGEENSADTFPSVLHAHRHRVEAAGCHLGATRPRREGPGARATRLLEQR